MLHDPSLSYPLFSCSLGCVSKIQVNKILILRVQTWGPQITSILWIFNGITKQSTRFCKTFSSWEFWNWELHIAFSGWKSTSPKICWWKNGKCFTVAEPLQVFRSELRSTRLLGRQINVFANVAGCWADFWVHFWTMQQNFAKIILSQCFTPAACDQ